MTIPLSGALGHFAAVVLRVGGRPMRLYRLRVFSQTRPLMWEVGLVDVTCTDADGQAVMMPWLEEEQEPFAQS
jgi:hypothetical protein